MADTISNTKALFYFTIGVGIAGGIAGYIASTRLDKNKSTVTNSVIIATVMASVFTIASAYFLSGSSKTV